MNASSTATLVASLVLSHASAASLSSAAIVSSSFTLSSQKLDVPDREQLPV